MVNNDNNFGELPATGFVREKLLVNQSKRRARVMGISRTTLWSKVMAQQFPQLVKLSPCVTAWRVEDVRAWIANPG